MSKWDKETLVKEGVFINHMKRAYEDEGHSYFFGLFTTLAEATTEAKSHIVDRAGKYRCEIVRAVPDIYNWEVVKVIYPYDFDPNTLEDL